jgi:LuxR family transcriptional regulator, quorum-sensing system regulator BjaR1
LNAQALDHGHFAFDVIDRIEQLDKPADVLNCMSSALGRFGFTSFVIGDRPNVRVSKPTFLLNGWPRDWSDHYTRNNYYRDDPIAAYSELTYDPYEWSEVPVDAEANPRAAEVLRAGREFGRNAGFVVPIYRPDRPTGVVTMCGERPEFEPNAKRSIHFISLYAYAKAVALSAHDPATRSRATLTHGEREVLTWTAAGKSAWEISAILDIAEDTVNWRLKQAYTKLNAINKVQAVVNAIRTREIIV